MKTLQAVFRNKDGSIIDVLEQQVKDSFPLDWFVSRMCSWSGEDRVKMMAVYDINVDSGGTKSRRHLASYKIH